jgi:DNA-binding XRE family transcriptional regulator
MKDTAIFVRRARARLKLNQQEFAELLGLERRSIIRFERGGYLRPAVYFAIKFQLDRDRLKRRAKARRAKRKQ